MMKLQSLLLLVPTVLAFWGSTLDDDTDVLKVPGENPLTFCEDPSVADHILRITKVDLSPNPPEAGKVLNIKATGNFTQVVEQGAYVNIVVKLGLIKLLQRTEDLCEQMKEVNKTCPLDKGELTIMRDVELPKQIPPAKFTVTADAYTVDDELITCLKASVSFMRGGSAFVKIDGQNVMDSEESIDL